MNLTRTESPRRIAVNNPTECMEAMFVASTSYSGSAYALESLCIDVTASEFETTDVETLAA
jgi:hypothetical protein